MTDLPDQEWRVEVDLDDDSSLRERLRDDLGRGVIVTRDGHRLFAYTTSEATARDAERVLREFGTVSVTVWDEEREAWLDAERGDVVEDPHAEHEGPEYFVLVESHDHAALEALAARFEDRPHELRRGKLLVGADDDAEVEALAERIRAEIGERGRVQVRADIFSDTPTPGFLWFESRMPGK